MPTENAVLMQNARESLKGKWGVAAATVFVYMLISVVIQIIPYIGIIASLVITGPLALGITIFYFSIARNQDTKLELLFKGFDQFGTALGAYILMCLFIFLWMLLLIIPGIIAAISYAMTFYIIADDRSIGVMDAIRKSKKMMDGYKWKFFCLGCRFIGWALLCILTLGIGFFWLSPYAGVSMVKFYDDIKDNPAVQVQS